MPSGDGYRTKLASVLVNDKGYDVYRDNRNGRFFTERHTLEGLCGGHHTSTEALELLAQLSKLSEDPTMRYE